MDLRARPYRSVLYIPGSRDRALEKARDLAVDAIIFDLEDAVTAEEKPNARALLAQVLAQGGYGARTRGAMVMALQHCLLAARAAGIICVDGVYNAFKDEEGLAAECAEGRDFGFDGKTLIHPAQVAIANAAFAPSEAEIALARRQIAAYEEARANGQGVAVVDGKIVENLHVETARATLAKADAIAKGDAA